MPGARSSASPPPTCCAACSSWSSSWRPARREVVNLYSRVVTPRGQPDGARRSSTASSPPADDGLARPRHDPGLRARAAPRVRPPRRGAHRGRAAGAAGARRLPLRRGAQGHASTRRSARCSPPPARPDRPVGACMVSSEGTCAAWYRHERLRRRRRAVSGARHDPAGPRRRRPAHPGAGPRGVPARRSPTRRSRRCRTPPMLAEAAARAGRRSPPTRSSSTRRCSPAATSATCRCAARSTTSRWPARARSRSPGRWCSRRGWRSSCCATFVARRGARRRRGRGRDRRRRHQGRAARQGRPRVRGHRRARASCRRGATSATTGSRPGDAVLVSGPLGDHGATVMACRHRLGGDGLRSDCAPLAGAGRGAAGLAAPRCTRCTTRPAAGSPRPATRSPRAPALRIVLEQAAVPVRPEVRAVCELLGLDPLYVACEGRIVAFVAAARRRPRRRSAARPPARRRRRAGRDAWRRAARGAHRWSCGRSYNTERPLDLLAGAELPRIC